MFEANYAGDTILQRPTNSADTHLVGQVFLRDLHLVLRGAVATALVGRLVLRQLPQQEQQQLVRVFAERQVAAERLQHNHQQTTSECLQEHQQCQNVCNIVINNKKTSECLLEHQQWLNVCNIINF